MVLHETLEYMKGCRGKSCTLPRHQLGGAGTGGTSGSVLPDNGMTLPIGGGRLAGSVGTGNGKRKHHRDPIGGKIVDFSTSFSLKTKKDLVVLRPLVNKSVQMRNLG